MNKLAIISNYLITLLSFSALTYSVLNYFDLLMAVSICITVVFAIFYTFAFFMICKGRSYKKAVSSSDKKLLDNAKTFLLLSQPSAILKVLLAIESITPDDDFADGFLERNGKIYYPFFSKDVLDEFDTLSVFKQFGGKAPIKLYCISASHSAKALTKTNLAIEIAELSDYFDCIKASLPQLPYSFSVVSPEKENVFKLLLNSKSSNGYLLFGLFMLLFSYVSPFRLYYLIFAAALIVAATVIKIYNAVKPA